MPGRQVVAAVCAAIAGALLVAPAHAARVSGLVFDDFDTNGKLDSDAAAGAVDVPVAGLVVKAITGTGTVVDSTTTGADGRYSLSAPDAKVRIELEVRSPWLPTRQLTSGVRSDEQFVDASSARTGVDFGVHKTGEFSVDNPAVFWTNQWAGPISGAESGRDAVRAVGFFTSPLSGTTFDAQKAAGKGLAVATYGQVGSTFGLGIDQRNGDLYLGAYYKRFSGLTSSGPGAIFRIPFDQKTSVFSAPSVWATVPDTGTDGHPPAAADWFATAARDQSWPLVGRTGLGSVEIDPADENLYTVNLKNRTLVRFALGGGSASPASTTPVPDPGCANGDWQPFSIGFRRSTGAMFVGGVCTAVTSQSAANLRAVVYRVTDPSGSPSFTRVLDLPLTYNRVDPHRNSTSNWQPWPTQASIQNPKQPGTTVLAPPQQGRGQTADAMLRNDESYPQLTGIAFVSGTGNMLLAFRDLMGDMSGSTISGEGNTSEDGGGGASATVQGDLLVASPNADGTFTLETNGVVGGVSGFGASAGAS